MIVRNIALTLFAVVAASAQTATSTTHVFKFPFASFGSSETAEIVVVNTAANATSGTAASCTGSISFVNAAGATIGSSTPFTVASGQSATAKLLFATTAASLRTVIHGEVSQTLPAASSTNPPCSLQIVFSTYDSATNGTHVLLTGAGSPSGLGGRN